MSTELTDLQLLHELEPVVEQNINRHMRMRKDWNPHDYIPWSDGKNFYALGGQDWDPDQSKLSEVAQVSMLQNLLTEDNLPSYHREIAMNFSMDGPWGGYWVNRWTAEENRHGIALRDYLVVTRAIDRWSSKSCASSRSRVASARPGTPPGRDVRREPLRLGHLRHVPGIGHPRVAPQHRQGVQRDGGRPTAATCFGRREPAHDLLPRRQRGGSGLRPPQSGDEVAAPGAAQLQDARIHGARVSPQGVVIAVGGVYDPRIHLDDVVMPVLKKWRIFEREDFTGEAAEMRDDLGKLVEELEETCQKFEVAKERRLERERKMAEKKEMKNLLVTSSSAAS